MMVIAGVLFSLAGLFVVRGTVPVKALKEHQDIAGLMNGIVGVVYAVILGFAVILVWEQFEDAKVTVAEEANSLANVYRLAYGFPAPVRRALRQQLRSYAQAVVQEEWGAMAEGRPSPRAWLALDETWELYERMEPRTNRENALYAESLTRLSDMSNQRRLRLLASRQGVPAIMWILLYVGAVTTIGFTYFFAAESLRAQVLMTSVMAADLMLALFLISALNYPFSGDVRIPPDPFIEVIGRMNQIEKHENLPPHQGVVQARPGHRRPG